MSYLLEAPSEPYEVYYRGTRIPWVTRWEPEALYLKPEDIVAGVTMPDDGSEGFFTVGITPDESDRVLREGAVIWWEEATHLQGTGKPQWKQVSSNRQRVCMRELRCQVCAMAVEQPISWFGPRSSIRVFDAGTNTMVTTSPPVCQACIPVAKALCPHIRAEGWLTVIPTGVHIVGITGPVAKLDPSGSASMTEEEWVFYDDDKPGRVPDGKSVIAKQEIAVLFNVVISSTS